MEIGSSLDNTIKITNSMYESGRMASDELEEQKTMLNVYNHIKLLLIKSIKGRVLGIFDKMNISNTITKFLINRGKSDTFLFFILVLLTLAIMYYTYYYVKPLITFVKSL